MNKLSEKEWLQEFQEFVNSQNALVPEEVSSKVLKYVKKDLSPSVFLVFGKMLLIQALIGTASLAICDQFGMNPFNTGFSLTQYFMRFGHSICMGICGFLFLSLSFSFAFAFLTREEFHVLRKNFYVQIPSVALLSLIALSLFGAQISLGIGLLWFLGACMGGFSVVGVNGYLAFRLTHHS